MIFLSWMSVCVKLFTLVGVPKPILHCVPNSFILQIWYHYEACDHDFLTFVSA